MLHPRATLKKILGFHEWLLEALISTSFVILFCPYGCLSPLLAHRIANPSICLCENYIVNIEVDPKSIFFFCGIVCLQYNEKEGHRVTFIYWRQLYKVF